MPCPRSLPGESGQAWSRVPYKGGGGVGMPSTVPGRYTPQEGSFTLEGLRIQEGTLPGSNTFERYTPWY